MRVTRHLAGLLVLGAALAGCGGDDDGAATTTRAAPAGAALTKDRYIAEADKVCAAAKKRIDDGAAALRASAEKTGTLPVSKVASFLTKTSLPAYDAMLEDLRALRPPKQDEKTIDGLVASLAGAIDTAKSDPVKYSRNTAPDPFDDANKRALDYGMKVCGS